jgi:hypothetical protein
MLAYIPAPWIRHGYVYQERTLINQLSLCSLAPACFCKALSTQPPLLKTSEPTIFGNPWTVKVSQSSSQLQLQKTYFAFLATAWQGGSGRVLGQCPRMWPLKFLISARVKVHGINMDSWFMVFPLFGIPFT